MHRVVAAVLCFGVSCPWDSYHLRDTKAVIGLVVDGNSVTYALVVVNGRRFGKAIPPLPFARAGGNIQGKWHGCIAADVIDEGTWGW